MTAVAGGCVVVGDQVNGVPLVIPAGAQAIVPHNAGKQYLYILMTDAALGQPIDNQDGLILVNNFTQTNITNTTAADVSLYAYIYFEIYSPQQSGFIPASEVYFL